MAIEGAEIKGKVQPSGEIVSLGMTDLYGEAFVKTPRGMDTLIVKKPGYEEATRSFRLLSSGSPAETMIEVRLVPLGGGHTDIDKEMKAAEP